MFASSYVLAFLFVQLLLASQQLLCDWSRYVKIKFPESLHELNCHFNDLSLQLMWFALVIGNGKAVPWRQVLWPMAQPSEKCLGFCYWAFVCVCVCLLCAYYLLVFIVCLGFCYWAATSALNHVLLPFILVTSHFWWECGVLARWVFGVGCDGHKLWLHTCLYL